MWRSTLALCVLFLAEAATPARAGILFHRQPKASPAERVGALVAALKTEPNERKRASAAEDLRHFDAKAYPEIVPALADAALNDPSASVRLEAVQSLGRTRPVSQEAGWALEQALAKDSSWRVRWQARSSLVQYHVSGYRSARPEQPVAKEEVRPPAATIVLPPTPAPASPRLRPVPQEGVIVLPAPRGKPTTAEPPLLPADPNNDGPSLIPPK